MKILSSVSNTDPDTIKHLAKEFGRDVAFHTGKDKKLICPCVKVNVPFVVLHYLECALSPNGNMMSLLEPGIYQILFNRITSPAHSVSIRRLDQNQQKDTTIYVGWGEDRMIDWRGIRPVKKS